jgi:hypothetical protein
MQGDERTILYDTMLPHLRHGTLTGRSPLGSLIAATSQTILGSTALRRASTPHSPDDPELVLGLSIGTDADKDKEMRRGELDTGRRTRAGRAWSGHVAGM